MINSIYEQRAEQINGVFKAMRYFVLMQDYLISQIILSDLHIIGLYANSSCIISLTNVKILKSTELHY